MPENLLHIIALCLYLLFLVLAVIWFVVSRFAPVQSVKAEVVDKHIAKSFSRYSGNGYREKYIIVFSVAGKKKSFYVSQFSYGGYRIGEKGTLKYKGDRLIGFE